MNISRLLARNILHSRKIKIFKIKNIPLSVFRIILLVGLSFLIISPIIFRLFNALKPMEELYNPTVFLIPEQPTFDYVRDVLNFSEYSKTFFSTILFTLVNSTLQIVSCTLVAYGIGRFKYWGRSIVYGAVFATLVVPTQTILLPLYLQFSKFSIPNMFTLTAFKEGVSIINTYWPFVFMSASALGLKNGLFIFLLSRFFKNMPDALEEAAYIDGCGALKTFVKIMLPASVTLIVTVFILSFVWTWNDNYYSTFFGENMKILSSMFSNIGSKIAYSLGERSNSLLIQIYNNTAAIIHMIPLIIIYIFGQQFLVQGVERSGIVG